MKKFFLILFFTSAFAFADSTNVLFIGNSYTYVNDLPLLFKSLSASAGKSVYIEMQAPGGYMLENHLTTQATIDAIKKGFWNFVVLQEQSQTPVIEYLRYHSMYPSAVILDSLIKYYNPNATTVFYMTWGRRNGGQQCIDTSCSPVFTNYFHMQDSLRSSYTMISNKLSALLSPCGEAWRTARIVKPWVNLWDIDDSHPTLDGSYLSACTFFARIFNQSPVGLSFHSSLPDSSALFYQQCALQTIGINNNTSTVPGIYELFQNYPNPFNNSTIIKFSIPAFSFVSIKLFDILGKEIFTLVNTNLKTGTYTIPLSCSNLPSGIYFYTLYSNDIKLTKKLLLIK